MMRWPDSLRRTTWFVYCDLENSLIPNIEILKSCGTPMERVLHFLYTDPRCFLIKPDIMRKSVDKAVEFGVPRASIAFIRAVTVLAHTSQGMWEVKLQTFNDLGLSDDKIFSIFRRQPSEKKSKSAVELLLGTGKYNISSIVTSPTSLLCSIEKRLEPRLQILGVLESRNLIDKWPCLSRVASLTNDKFLERFVSPYSKRVGEAFDGISYLKRQKIYESLNTCLNNWYEVV